LIFLQEKKGKEKKKVLDSNDEELCGELSDFSFSIFSFSNFCCLHSMNLIYIPCEEIFLT